MTTTNDQAATDHALRQIFKGMDAHQAQEIREAYNMAIDGLATLPEQLEIADAQQTPTAGPLLTEHLYAVEALKSWQQDVPG